MWYLLQCKVRSEQQAEIHLTGNGYNCYLPLTLKDRRFVRTPGVVTEPLFPGYIFLHMDEGRDDFHPVTKTPGVMRIVKFTRDEDGNLCPTPVPDALIEALQAAETEQGIHSRKVDYAPGDSVRFRIGPLRDYEGVIRAIKSANGEQRAMILIKALEKPVDAPVTDLEPLT